MKVPESVFDVSERFRPSIESTTIHHSKRPKNSEQESIKQPSSDDNNDTRSTETSALQSSSTISQNAAWPNIYRYIMEDTSSNVDGKEISGIDHRSSFIRLFFVDRLFLFIVDKSRMERLVVRIPIVEIPGYFRSNSLLIRSYWLLVTCGWKGWSQGREMKPIRGSSAEQKSR